MKKIDMLIKDGLEYRQAINMIERDVAKFGSTKEDQLDWRECNIGYRNVISKLAKLIGNKSLAEELINGRLN